MTQPATSTHLSIGEVLTLIQADFPDVTISKIRFLESQGLVAPERTSSGYRKFYEADIDQLRWILAQQRDNFLPLKVIKRMLDQGIDVNADPDQPSLFNEPSTAAPAPDAAGSQEARRPRSRAHPTLGASGNTDAAPEPARPEAGASVTADEPGADGVAPDSATESPNGSSVEEPTKSVPAPPEAAKAADRPAHSTPADVVAALQEDPRSDRRPKRGRAAGGSAQPTDEVAGVPAGRSGRLGSAATGENLTRDELCEAAGIDAELLASLEQFGLVVPTMLGANPAYGPDSLQIAVAAARCAELGIEPRHLRIYKVAAEREAGFLEQMVVPLLKQRNPVAREQAIERTDELLAIGADLHGILLRRQLGPLLGL